MNRPPSAQQQGIRLPPGSVQMNPNLVNGRPNIKPQQF